jgi:hypothetical protein
MNKWPAVPGAFYAVVLGLWHSLQRLQTSTARFKRSMYLLWCQALFSPSLRGALLFVIISIYSHVYTGCVEFIRSLKNFTKNFTKNFDPVDDI